MAPRNFSEDGAAGAGSQGGNFGTTNATGGTTTTDSGVNSTGIQLGARGVMGIDSTGNLNPSGIQGNDSGGGGGGGGGGGLASFPSGGGGASPITPTGRSGYGGFNVPPAAGGAPTIANGAANWAAGLSFKDGGAIPEGDDDGDEDPNATDPQGSALGQSLQKSINAAMQSVQNALSYGRQLHGLGGGQQEAAAMPTVPGNQSESGIPRERPMPGPLPPTSNPFGKRADAGAIDDGDGDEAAAMPSVPFSESQRERPMPGPLPPTSNPFGKRGQQTSDAGSDAAPDQAIDTEEEAA